MLDFDWEKEYNNKDFDDMLIPLYSSDGYPYLDAFEYTNAIHNNNAVEKIRVEYFERKTARERAQYENGYVCLMKSCALRGDCPGIGGCLKMPEFFGKISSLQAGKINSDGSDFISGLIPRFISENEVEFEITGIRNYEHLLSLVNKCGPLISRTLRDVFGRTIEASFVVKNE
jgi:hypothetical protein